MSKSYNQLLKGLVKANKRIKSLEKLSEVMNQENKQLSFENLELQKKADNYEHAALRWKTRLDETEAHCVEYEKQIRSLKPFEQKVIELEKKDRKNIKTIKGLTKSIKTISRQL
jgi:hypothetical protein